MNGPLDGLTVLELAGIGPVPFAGMLLAGMGADVILVDRPDDPASPDLMVGGVGRGKRSVVIDLKHTVGPSTLLRLVEGADALIEGMRPGVAERLGVGPEHCLVVKPDLIYGRMTGWGRRGPYADMAGHDINYIGLVGALGAIGEADRPIPPLNLVGDYGGGGLYLVSGVLAALLDRDRSGGRVVEAAMVDGAASLMSPIYGMLGAGAWRDARHSNLLDGAAPFYTTYATIDGKHVAVGALEPQFYAALLDGLGIDEAELSDRLDPLNWPELERRFAATFGEKTQADWERTFTGSDACVTPVLELTDAPNHEANVHRRVFSGDLPAPAPRFDTDDPNELGPVPERGADTDAILSAAGFEAREIDRLRAAGVVA